MHGMIVSLYYMSIVSHVGLFIFRSCATITPYTMSSSCPGCGVPGAGAGLSPQSATGPVTTRSFEPGWSKNHAESRARPERKNLNQLSKLVTCPRCQLGHVSVQ